MRKVRTAGAGGRWGLGVGSRQPKATVGSMLDRPMTCPLCRQRKARRTCPALGEQICAVCCGTKRLVEIHCPETCPYLASAREHPPAVVQREQQRDVSALMHTMRDVTDRQQQLMFLLLGIARRYEGDALQSLVDADVVEAARSLASTLETANRGVIYEHQPATMAAQRLVTDWKALFKDVGVARGRRGAGQAGWSGRAACHRTRRGGARTRAARRRSCLPAAGRPDAAASPRRGGRHSDA